MLDPQHETVEGVLAWLKPVNSTTCAYVQALATLPNHIRETLERVRNDRDVSTPRIRELLGMYMDKIPSETCVRNHRNSRGCPVCDKGDNPGG